MELYPVVIGFTGSIGSGCSETCKVIEEFSENKPLKLSLSQLLREEINKDQDLKKEFDIVKKKGMEEIRLFLQEQGNRLREYNNNPHILVDKVLDKIEELKNQGKLTDKDFILIDSIKNISEIDALRDRFRVYIFAIYADEDERWHRVMDIYNHRHDLFLRDDKRDHKEKKWHGQQVDSCVDSADILIKNDVDIVESEKNRENYFKKINYYLDLIKNPKRKYPKMEESYMNMAYSMAARSRCMQRKVGALITTEDHEIVSLGYNDVPSKLQSCAEKYKECYRKKKKREILNEFKYCPKCGNEITEEKKCEKCNISIEEDIFKNKNLGLCRSLHAEENAIVKAAKAGIPLKNGIIFTTTFPCNLCANKIKNVGLKKVIFVEPYPLKETIEILNEETSEEKKVEVELFEGVKSRAFFELYKRIGEIERQRFS